MTNGTGIIASNTEQTNKITQYTPSNQPQNSNFIDDEFNFSLAVKTVKTRMTNRSNEITNDD